MKYLITGVAGFVGSSLARRLLMTPDAQVVGVDCLTDYYDTALKRRNLSLLQSDAFNMFEADLAETDLDKLLEGVDVVFHQAGQPGIRRSWGSEFNLYNRQNVLVTQRLLEAATKATQLKRFVYASSSSIYGDAETYPTSEIIVPRPMSPYGVTKLAGEHLVSLYGVNFGLPTVSLRYFTVFGPRQRPDMAFTRFLRAAETASPIYVYGSGEQIRDFTYIDDVVDANVRAGESLDLKPGTVMNVAGGSHSSVNHVLDVIGSLTGKQLDIRRLPTVAGDVARTGGSIERIGETLGWTPRVSVEQGLEVQLSWVRDCIEPAATP